MNDDDLRTAFAQLRESESKDVPPFLSGVPVPSPARHNLRLAFVAALLVLLVAVGYFGRKREVMTTTSISTWRAPTDFLLRTPGRELIDSVPQLTPQIPGGRS
ncbi:MAG TPA: hypothetical protein VGS96_09610 [Thermoanaerobaculia bacterium]|nr:hypothetical protein [Thermoanaerobaculia bacterium]